MTHDPPEPAALLELALDAARAAGRYLVDERPADLDVAATKTSPTDVVTAMDRGSERLIVARLRTARPRDGVLGEEGAADAGSSGVRWVIDPVDGTVNYLYGLPEWAVSVAAEVDGVVVAGVVHAPALGETWTATLGGGAALDGRVLRRERGVALERALVATGFSYESANRALQARLLVEVLPCVRDVRRAGSAALDLCGVAGGRHDGYFERGTHHWDIAAAALVAREAGVTVGGLPGAGESEDLVVAAAEPLFAELQGLLAAHWPYAARADDVAPS